LILNQVDWTRTILVPSILSIIVIYFLYLAILIIKRNRNLLNVTLSCYYFFVSIAFIIVIISVPIRVNPLAYILYFIALFLLTFSNIFLPLFSINLLRKEKPFSLKIEFLFIIIYGLINLFLLLFPNGISYNEITNWTPIYTWDFLIVFYIVYSLSILIPQIILSVKLHHKFLDKQLKKKLRFFFGGTFLNYLISYCAILNNTWNNPIYNIIFVFISLLIVPSGLLLYKGIGKGL